MSEIYVSVDIEADGPIPGDYSMLSLGAVAYDPLGTLLGTYSANLVPMIEAEQDVDTMAWWATQPKAWGAMQKRQRLPGTVMEEFYLWLTDDLGAKEGQPNRNHVVFVGAPASYDFCFVYWYFHHFVGKCPFGFRALDIQTAAWTIMKGEFRNVVKGKMPKEWFDPSVRHTHIALDDAREQGHLFFSIRKALGITA